MIKLNNNELSYFCSQMAIILSSGISSVEGLYMMKNDEEVSAEEKKLYEAIISYMEKGDYLAASLEKAEAFPPYVIRMTDIGEKTGTLDNVMDSLGKHYEREEEIRQSIRQAVSYPIVMAGMILAVILVLLLEVMPIFKQVFRQLGTEMTGFAGFLYKIGNIIGNYSVAFIVLAAAIMLLIFWSVCTDKGRIWGRNFLVKFKFFKKVQEDISTSRFAGGMALALKSGFTSDAGMDMVSGIIDDEGFNEKIKKCRKMIADGEVLDEALREAGILKGVYARMITIGNRTGESDVVMERIATLCQKNAEASINNALGAIEPVLVIALSIIIGAILLSVMFPLLGIVSSI
ncbi:type IV pilus assembly protein PilC [Lachnospiraceae bacterium KH1T2]|nr:type IV pilus assembly protein PilC [Lachnospiraceae bacterium KH1T2]